MSQNQKSMDEERKPSEEEFRMDLTLQKAHSCSEEDTAIPTNQIASRVDIAVPAPALVSTPAAVPSHIDPSAPTTVTAGASVSPRADPPLSIPLTCVSPRVEPTPHTIPTHVSPLTPPQEEEDDDDEVDTPCEPTPTVSSLEDVTASDPAGIGKPDADVSPTSVGPAEELQGLLQEETLLQLEQQELLNLQADLQGRVQGEKDEIEKLRTELEIARTKYNYR